MKHDVTFVTGVYDCLSTTEFAGRNNRGAQYAFSLAQMHDMGAPIYCFTDKVNMNRYFPALYGHGIDNFTFINYNLNEHPLSSEIQRVKDTNVELFRKNSAWSTRCVEIMWGKFDWLLHVINEIGVAEDKYIYWIDAGLSHNGILPMKYSTVFNGSDTSKVNASRDYHNSFVFDKIFKDGFPDYLAEYTGKGKMMHMFCRNPQHDDASHLNVPKNIRGTAVGGLFGGDITLVKAWAEEAIEICKDLLAHDFLIKEEDINSYMINKSWPNDDLTLYLFDTWYHEDWNNDLSRGRCYDPEHMKPWCDFFEPFVNKTSKN
jgi:hypothetical protein